MCVGVSVLCVCVCMQVECVMCMWGIRGVHICSVWCVYRCASAGDYHGKLKTSY